MNPLAFVADPLALERSGRLQAMSWPEDGRRCYGGPISSTFPASPKQAFVLVVPPAPNTITTDPR